MRARLLELFTLFGCFQWTLSSPMRLIGNGTCEDATNVEYDFLQYNSIASDSECGRLCIDVGTQIKVAPVGFSRTLAGSCSCNFNNSTIDSVLTTHTTPNADVVDTTKDGTGTVTNSTGPADGNCYAFPPPCDVRMLFAVDHTYASGVRGNIEEAKAAMHLIADELMWGPKTEMGIWNLRQHRIVPRLSFSTNESTQLNLFKAEVDEIEGGFKHRATNFWPLFSGSTDNLANMTNGQPAVVVIISDGRLLYKENYSKMMERKNAMRNRLFSATPRFLCVGVGFGHNNDFMNNLCDAYRFEGYEGTSLPFQIQEIFDGGCPQLD